MKSRTIWLCIFCILLSNVAAIPLSELSDLEYTESSCNLLVYSGPQRAKSCDGKGYTSILEAFNISSTEGGFIIERCGETMSIEIKLQKKEDITSLREINEGKSKIFTKTDIDYSPKVQRINGMGHFYLEFDKLPTEITLIELEMDGGQNKIINEGLQYYFKDLVIDVSDISYSGFNINATSDAAVIGVAGNRSEYLLLDPTVTINSTLSIQDARVQEDFPSTNYGSQAWLTVRDYTNGHESFYAKFDIRDTIANASTITNAVAYFNYYSQSNDNLGTVTIRNMSCTSFDESSITYSNQGTQCPIGGITLATWPNLNDQVFGWYTVNVTSVASSGLFFLLAECSSGNADVGFFKSSEAPSNVPYLNITFSVYPMSFSAVNCTSCNISGEIAYGDTVVPYETLDATPSFKFNTNNNAFCRISNQNLSYSAMNSTRDCTIGEGTTTHICDLLASDELIYPNQSVYVSCSLFDVQATTAFPTVLQMIEENRTQSIERGIKSSIIWPGAAVFSNQQIYLRSISGKTNATTADYVAQYGNQRWILNYHNTSTLGLFNLSPVVYVLEITGNKSYYEIEQQVSAYINSTKN